MMEQYAMQKTASDSETVVRLELGASVDKLDDEGQSPLHVAVEYLRRYLKEILISNQCNLDLNNRLGMGYEVHDPKYGFTLESKALANSANVVNHTLLFHASILGRAEVVQYILKSGGGAHVNISDIKGSTPLTFAARFGHEEVVRILITGGAQVNVSDHNGNTPLMFAAGSGDEEVVRILIRDGAQVNFRNKWNGTALHEASSNAYEDVVRLLLKEDGIDLDPEDCDGETPLHLACFVEDIETVEQLLKAGANIKIINKEGKSAISISISEENSEIVRLLVEYGAHFEDEECFRMFQNTSLSFKESVLKDVDLCTRSLLNKFHNQSLPALERITRFDKRLPRIKKLKLSKSQIHEIENFVSNDIRENNFRNLERTCSSVLCVLCVQCLVNNQ